MPDPQQTLTIQQALDLAVQHQTAGHLSQAENIYQQILQNDPNQPVALHFLGVIAHLEGKNDTAVDLITRALAIKPDYVKAHSNLGMALQGIGRLDDAVASYHRALDLQPDLAGTHYNLGNALTGLGDLEGAVASYGKAIGFKSDYPEAHNNLGNALKDRGKLEESLVSYHKALALKPDYVVAHNNLGIALQQLGRAKEAVTSYHNALAVKPDHIETHSNLGNALKSLGKLNDAVASHQRAATLTIAQNMDQNILGNHSDAEQILRNICHNNTFLNPAFYVWAFIDICCEIVNHMLDRREIDIAGEKIRWLYMLVANHQTFNALVQRYFDSVDGEKLFDTLGMHAKATHLSMQSQYFYQNGQYDEAEDRARRCVNETKVFFEAAEQSEDGWLLIRKSLKNIKNAEKARTLLEQFLLTIVK